jgi:putative transposase
VTSANTSDQAGFRLGFTALLLVAFCVERVFADSGYRGVLGEWVVHLTQGQTVLEIVKPQEGRVGFGIDPKRWIVERSISWLSWSRRLSKDYEQSPQSSEAWIDVSAIRTAVRKLEPS